MNFQRNMQVIFQWKTCSVFLGAWLRSIAMGWLLIVGLEGLHAADPSFKKPDEPLLKLGAIEEGASLWDKSNKLEQEIRKGLEKLAKSKIPDPDNLNELCASVTLLNLYADRLKVLGETAGTDWDFRNDEYDRLMNQGLAKLWGTPKGDPARQKANVILTKSAEKRRKQLEAIQGMVRDGKIVEAEERFDKAIYDFYSVAGVLSTVEREPFFKPYEITSSVVVPARNTLRAQTATEKLKAESQDLINKYTTAVNELQSAAKALAQGGSPTYAGVTASGPGIVELFLKDWSGFHLGLIRATILDRVAPGAGSTYGSSPPNSNEDPWVGNARALAVQALTAIQELIEADAKVDSAPAAADNHAAYIRILAPWMNRLLDETWTDTFEKSLMALAKKGNLESSVALYNEASLDLLRWRAKGAAQQADLAKKSYPELRQKVRDTLVMTETKPGLFRDEKSKGYLPTLYCAVPRLIPALQTELNEAAIHAPGLIRLDGEKGVWMTQWSSGTYCRLPSELPELVGAKDLSGEILVDADHPPLNLTAASAWVTSVRVECLEVGGKIQDVAVEANSSRAANLPATAAALIDFGKTVSSGSKGQAATGVTLRCTLKPDWIHHRYYFVALP